MTAAFPVKPHKGNIYAVLGKAFRNVGNNARNVMLADKQGGIISGKINLDTVNIFNPAVSSAGRNPADIGGFSILAGQIDIYRIGMHIAVGFVRFKLVGNALFLGIRKGIANFRILQMCIRDRYGISRFVIRPLKRNNPQALRMEDLPGMKGTVKLELRQDFTGTIIVLSSIGSQITYSAKPIPEVEKIPVGTQVVIMDVGEDRVCIVRPEAQVQQDENAADSKRCDR